MHPAPLFVLVGALIYGFTPTYAAGIAILSVIAASWLSKNPMKLGDIIEAMLGRGAQHDHHGDSADHRRADRQCRLHHGDLATPSR